MQTRMNGRDSAAAFRLLLFSVAFDLARLAPGKLRRSQFLQHPLLVALRRRNFRLYQLLDFLVDLSKARRLLCQTSQQLVISI